ncbi:MAG: glutaredoxin family protein [Aquabacterium sp.]
MYASKRTTALLGLIALLLSLPAAAQFKIVGPDGSITDTDRPPPQAGGAKVTPLGRETRTVQAEGTPLPTELRQAVQRFPVVLYTSADCPPCESGRRLLTQRGIPLTERLVTHDDDAEALMRLTGARTVPALTVGSQALRGFNETDWHSYLDAAGYPKESRLPRDWKAPAAAPLVARQPEPPQVPALPATTVPQAAQARPAAQDLPPAQPGGIRF